MMKKMMMKTLPLHGALAACALMGACMAEGDLADGPDGPAVEIAVQALTLDTIKDAVFDLRVATTDDTVFEVRVTSSQFGDGAGSATYVGPCDASFATNTVTVDIIGLYDATVATPGVYGDAAPAGFVEFQDPGPLSREVDCDENADNLVVFDVTLMRPANQGFFDVAVNFNDIFCSAKYDCGVGDLLHDGANGRAKTHVFGFACSGGDFGAGEATELYLDDIVITCSSGDPAAVENCVLCENLESTITELEADLANLNAQLQETERQLTDLTQAFNIEIALLEQDKNTLQEACEANPDGNCTETQQLELAQLNKQIAEATNDFNQAQAQLVNDINTLQDARANTEAQLNQTDAQYNDLLCDDLLAAAGGDCSSLGASTTTTVLTLPTAGTNDGNQGAAAEAGVFQWAVYTGDEQLTNLDGAALNKRYYNVAIGVGADMPAGCTLSTQGTADGSASAVLENNAVPAGHVYPYIEWFIEDLDTCADNHPLDGVGSGVQTRYTGTTDAAMGFDHALFFSVAPLYAPFYASLAEVDTGIDEVVARLGAAQTIYAGGEPFDAQEIAQMQDLLESAKELEKQSRDTLDKAMNELQEDFQGWIIAYPSATDALTAAQTEAVSRYEATKADLEELAQQIDQLLNVVNSLGGGQAS